MECTHAGQGWQGCDTQHQLISTDMCTKSTNQKNTGEGTHARQSAHTQKDTRRVHNSPSVQQPDSEKHKQGTTGQPSRNMETGGSTHHAGQGEHKTGASSCQPLV